MPQISAGSDARPRQAIVFSAAQVQLMDTLLSTEHGCTATEIAERIRRSRSVPVNLTAKTLEARGLARRQFRCSGDGTPGEWLWLLTSTGRDIGRELATGAGPVLDPTANAPAHLSESLEEHGDG